jgi:hypothetical protein
MLCYRVVRSPFSIDAGVVSAYLDFRYRVG